MSLDPRAAFILGHRIESRGRTWSTWTIDDDDEPTEPHPLPLDDSTFLDEKPERDAVIVAMEER